MSIERLKQWEGTMPRLSSHKYYIKLLSFDAKKLSAFLVEYNSFEKKNFKPKKVLVEFGSPIFAYRNTDESFRLSSNFWKDSGWESREGSLFIVVGSSYIQELLEKSKTTVNDYPGNLTHFIFLGVNEVLDVITSSEPCISEIA